MPQRQSERAVSIHSENAPLNKGNCAIVGFSLARLANIDLGPYRGITGAVVSFGSFG